MKKEHLQILQHSLGVDEFGRITRGFRGADVFPRNYFCAGGKDEDVCRELIALGYMRQHPTTRLYPYLNCSVTEAGIAAMRAESPKPPKLSRAQQRYRRFLEEDSGLNFGEWLRELRHRTNG